MVCVMFTGVMMMNVMDGAAETQYLFYLQDGNETELYYSVTGSVEEAMQQAGKVLYENDSYTVENTSRDVYTVTITRAASCVVEADGKQIPVSFHPQETTVAEVLQQAGVSVGEDDLVSYSMSELVTDGETIRVSRVTYESYLTDEIIDWQYDYEPTRYLGEGCIKIFASGSDGEKQVEHLKTYVDGELVSDEVVDETVTKEVTNGRAQLGDSDAPIDHLEAPEWLTFDEDGVPEQATRVISGLGTAYTSDSGVYGSTGRYLSEGYVAVDPSIIPYGTKLYIKTKDGSWDYGYAIAADTGSAMLSGRILVDQYMNSYWSCMQYGVREVDIYILEDLDAHVEID
jgi:3D (Asp-Asp-Asp) domain-containing protein